MDIVFVHTPLDGAGLLNFLGRLRLAQVTHRGNFELLQGQFTRTRAARMLSGLDLVFFEFGLRLLLLLLRLALLQTGNHTVHFALHRHDLFKCAALFQQRTLPQSDNLVALWQVRHSIEGQDARLGPQHTPRPNHMLPKMRSDVRIHGGQWIIK